MLCIQSFSTHLSFILMRESMQMPEFTLDKELQESYIHSNESTKSTGAPGDKVPIDRREHGEIHSNIKVE